MISNEDRITCTFNGKKFVKGHECVDLGLPSGTLWAKCNLGADKETEFGDYYQFGQDKKYEQTYKGYIPLECDTVSSIWGDAWKTPTKEQFRELIEHTEGKWCCVNGINGYKFTSKVDETKYIFFPACGGASYGSVSDVGCYGYYWSSSPYTDRVSYAYGLTFGSVGVYWTDYGERCIGCAVRGVLAENLSN